jgi:DNA adenine methylase
MIHLFTPRESTGFGLISRIGGKTKLKDIIINKYFPKDYENMIYIEPFLGGGTIFLSKNPSVKEVINDLDKIVYEIFKGIKKYSTEDILKDVNGYYTKEDFYKIKDSKPTSEYGKFLKTFIIYKCSFLGLSRTYNERGQIKISTNKLNKWKERLNNSIIKNVSYEKLIKEYDSKNTFFYLDPPYEKSERLYKHDVLNIEEIYNIMKNIKGKFLISYNDSKKTKELFKNYYIHYETTKYEGSHQLGSTVRNVKELLISNYKI